MDFLPKFGLPPMRSLRLRCEAYNEAGLLNPPKFEHQRFLSLLLLIYFPLKVKSHLHNVQWHTTSFGCSTATPSYLGIHLPRVTNESKTGSSVNSSAQEWN